MNIVFDFQIAYLVLMITALGGLFSVLIQKENYFWSTFFFFKQILTEILNSSGHIDYFSIDG